MHKVLVNRLFKPVQEKVWLGDRLEMTIAVDLGHKATKQTNKTIKVRSTIKNVQSSYELQATRFHDFSITFPWYFVIFHDAKQ